MNNAAAIVVGAGNIGSYLIPRLGQLPSVEAVTLIDADVYEQKNLTGQDITPRDIGVPKAQAQARRLRRQDPRLRVDAIVGRLEDVPMGQLRGDVILGCLDSKRSRRLLAERAWRLGIPYIDAGVAIAPYRMARVDVYVPGDGEIPCYECGWDNEDYASQEQVLACSGQADSPAPTNGSAALGALAAALQANVLDHLLSGRRELVPVGKQIVMDTAHHTMLVNTIRRHPSCRFDHGIWHVERLALDPKQITVGDALERVVPGSNGAAELWIEGMPFVTAMACPDCGKIRKLFRLSGRLRPHQRTCTDCERAMVPVGFHMVNRLHPRLPTSVLRRKLSSLGMQAADILTTSRGEHVEIQPPA